MTVVVGEAGVKALLIMDILWKYFQIFEREIADELTFRKSVKSILLGAHGDILIMSLVILNRDIISE